MTRNCSSVFCSRTVVNEVVDVEVSLWLYDDIFSEDFRRRQQNCGGDRSGQVWGHTPEQRVATSTLRRYSLSLRLAIAQADARPIMPVSSNRTPPEAIMKRVDAPSA